MKTFKYTIQNEPGIHARPAGMLAKTAKTLGSVVSITVTVNGGNKEASEAAMKEFLTANL